MKNDTEFDDSLLDNLCELSKISLNEDERIEILESLKDLVREFSIISDINDFSANINEIETAKLRNDIVFKCENINGIKNNLPSLENDFLKVPKIIDEI